MRVKAAGGGGHEVDWNAVLLRRICRIQPAANGSAVANNKTPCDRTRKERQAMPRTNIGYTMSASGVRSATAKA